MRYVGLLALVAFIGCGQSSPSAPSSALVVEPLLVTYSINIPNAILAQQFQREYPNGVRTNPIAASFSWNYRAAYHGSPNVYYGPLAPPPDIYQLAGIVVAPPDVAGKDVFQAWEWPNETGQPFGGSEPHVAYAWLGRFVYTVAFDPGVKR